MHYSLRHPDREYHYRDHDYFVTIARMPIGEAYPRNGNVGNPTRYYSWRATYVDKTGEEGQTNACKTRRGAWEAYRRAVGYSWQHHYIVTQQAMDAAYVGRGRP